MNTGGTSGQNLTRLRRYELRFHGFVYDIDKHKCKKIKMFLVAFTANNHDLQQ